MFNLHIFLLVSSPNRPKEKWTYFPESLKVNHALYVSKSRGKHTIRYQKRLIDKIKKKKFLLARFCLNIDN